jgi:phosphonatase-like hydrolase
MPIELVVFDMAGTTVYDGDTVHNALLAALAGAGIVATRDEVNAVMGMPKPVAIRRLASTHRATPPPDEELAAIYADFERLMLTYYRTDPSVRETDGAESVFRELRARGIKVALDTGFRRAIVDAILSRLGWDSTVIDASVASDEVDRGRPHPDLIHRAMEATGVRDVTHVAKVGDTPADLLEGDAAGCRLVVGVTTGSHARAELEGHPHTHLIASLRELPVIVAAADDGVERAPGSVIKQS